MSDWNDSKAHDGFPVAGKREFTVIADHGTSWEGEHGGIGGNPLRCVVDERVQEIGLSTAVRVERLRFSLYAVPGGIQVVAHAQDMSASVPLRAVMVGASGGSVRLVPRDQELSPEELSLQEAKEKIEQLEEQLSHTARICEELTSELDASYADQDRMLRALGKLYLSELRDE